VIIIAGGYRPIISDNGLVVRPDARSPVQANAKLRRGQ
jgi:hypothetical protein